MTTRRAVSAEGARIAWNSALLSAGEAVVLAIGFFTTIFVTDTLGDDYGVFIGAQRFVGTFVAIISFGLTPLLVRAFAARKADPGTLLGSTLLMRFVLGAVFAAATLLTAVATGYLPDARWLIAIFVLLEVVAALTDTFIAVCEGEERMGRSAVIAMSRSVATLIGAGVAVVTGGGLFEFAMAYLAGRIVQLIVAMAAARAIYRTWSLRAKPAVIPPLAREALWFVAIGWTATLQSTIAVLILTRLGSTIETARFGAALNFVEVTLVLPVLLQRALLPAFSRLAAAGTAPAVASAGLRLVPAVLVPAGAGLALLAPAILQLYPSGEFADAAPVLMLMGGWLAFVGPSYVCATFLTGIDRLRALLLVNIAGVVTQAAFCLWLVPPFGAVGAAGGSLIGYGVTMIIMVWAAARHGVRVPWGGAAGILTSTAVMAVAVYFVRGASLLLAVPVGAVAYAVALFLILPRDSIERRLLESAAARLRNRRSKGPS